MEDERVVGPSEDGPTSGGSRSRIQALLSTVIDAVVTIDSAGVIDSFNPAAETLFGYSAPEILGQNISVLMPSPHRGQHDAYIQEYLRTGKPKIIGIGRELIAVKKDGTPFPMELAVSEFEFQGERFFTGVIRDVTERRLVESHRRQQEKLSAVGQLASGLAHEIGNPLASISALTQGVARKIQDPELVAKLDRIGEHIARISGIVREMVDFARPARTQWKHANINAVVEESVSLLHHDKRASRISIELDLHPDLPRSFVMPELLGQVFINLALNAFDALESVSDSRPRRLVVTTGRVESSGDLEIAFQDTGPGIPDEIVEQVLEPFFTTKEPGQGTGLGLAVSHGIVKEHGGRILVEGRPGDGARILIELPIRKEAPEPGEPAA